MAQGKPNTAERVAALIEPVIQQLQLRLWDVRYEKEGAQWYLRVLIDKAGGLTINDCEQASHAIDPILDEADPIQQSYVLEVGSPGIERELRADWHFTESIGQPVNLRLIRPVEGVRDFAGILTGYADGRLTVRLDDEIEMELARAEAAYVRLSADLDFGG